MPQDGRYSAFADIANSQAAEFDATTTVGPDGVSETRCAIISETGKSFSTRFMYSQPAGTHHHAMPTNLMVRLLVDGQCVSKTGKPLRIDAAISLSMAVDGSIKRPLVFAPMRVVAHDAQVPDARGMTKADNKVAEGIGKIVVEFCTGKQVLRQPKAAAAGGEKFKQAVLSEHQKKAVFVSHSAGFGDARPRSVSKSTYRFVCDKPVKRFIFEYASKVVHELSGRIPAAAAAATRWATRADSPPRRASRALLSGSSKRKRRDGAADADIDKDKTEQQLSKVKAEIGEGIKRRRTNEPGAPAAVSDRKVVVVTLLDSDEEEASSSSRRRAARRSAQPNKAKLVVSLLESDDD